MPQEELERRDAMLLQRLPGAVDRFLSPSTFLRDELVRAGLPAGRIQIGRAHV